MRIRCTEGEVRPSAGEFRVLPNFCAGEQDDIGILCLRCEF